MKKSVLFMILVLVLALCILSQNTRYNFMGCIIFMVLFSLISFKDLYKYQKRKQEYGDGITLERENLWWKLISCMYFSVYFILNFLINDLHVVGIQEIIMAASILIYGIVSIYSMIWQKPIIYKEGILLSNGEVLLLSDINSANIEQNAFMDDCKKLIINCDKGNYTLKFKDYEYDDIKKVISIEEVSRARGNV